MGCDIHPYVERRECGSWSHVPCDLFDVRCYSFFGWLADMRNYSAVSPLGSVHCGLPEDCTEEVAEEMGCLGYHTHSWVTLAKLLEVDYEQEVEDRRWDGEQHGTGPDTCPAGEGVKMPLREFLGEWYFKHLERMTAIGSPEDVRLVFCFDN